MFNLCWLPVFVCAKNTNIEVEPRVFKVIRVTAIKGDLLLGRENKPDVIISFEAIKMKRPTLVKGDNIRTQAGLFFAFLFNFSDHFLAGGRCLFWGRSYLYGSVYSPGNIFGR